MINKTLKIVEKNDDELVLEATHEAFYQSFMILLPILATALTIAGTIYLESGFAMYFGITAVIGAWALFKKAALKTITFSKNQVLVGYRLPFFKTSKKYRITEAGIDWFVSLEDDIPIIELGVQAKVITTFKLDDISLLPQLTESVGKVTNLDLIESNALKEKEIIQYRKNQALPEQISTDFLKYQETDKRIDVLFDLDKGFWFDLEKNTLVFYKRFNEKSIDFQEIIAIKYSLAVVGQNYTVEFKYRLKSATFYTSFFSINNNLSTHQHGYYHQLKADKELKNAIDKMKQQEKLKHIQFIQTGFVND